MGMGAKSSLKVTKSKFLARFLQIKSPLPGLNKNQGVFTDLNAM